MPWSYFAMRVNGDGTETLLATELPLSNVSITDDLSGPGAFSATITPAVARLKDDTGQPLFKPWSTAIYAENDGIRGGYLLVNMPENDQGLGLDCVGFTGYPKDRPYTAELPQADGIDADPANLFRHIWSHIQSAAGQNLGIVVDDTLTGLKIGSKATDVAFETGEGDEVAFESGPYVLSYFATADLGKELDDLAANRFEYHMEHKAVGETVQHFLRIGYPTIGRRREDLRFTVGENIEQVPQLMHDGEGFATDVQVLGAGEGRKMIRYTASASTTGVLRRLITVEDKSCKTVAQARVVGEAELKRRGGQVDIESIIILNHRNALLGTYGVGDEICIGVDGTWSNRQELWVRLSTSINPDTSTVTATVARVGKV